MHESSCSFCPRSCQFWRRFYYAKIVICSADDNNSFSSASAASSRSDAASSHGVKMSKKTRQSARARANVAPSDRGRAHSNFATVVSSSSSRASAASLLSASVLSSSKKHRNHFIFDSEDDSSLRFLLSARNTKKKAKFTHLHTAVLFWAFCHGSQMMTIVLAISLCSWRLHLLAFLICVKQFLLPRPMLRISPLMIVKALHRVARHRLTAFKSFGLLNRRSYCVTRFPNNFFCYVTAVQHITFLIIACFWQTFVIRILRFLGGILRCHGP